MAQATITLKLSPVEFSVFQEAMMDYLTNLTGDDNGSKYRKMTAKGMLGEIGVGILPEIKPVQQVSFDTNGRVRRYDEDEESEEESEVTEEEEENLETIPPETDV